MEIIIKMNSYVTIKFVFLFAIFVTTLAVGKISDEDRIWYAKKQATHEVSSFVTPKAHVLRLAPGEDLLESLWKYARVTNLTAASVITAVGSLTTTNIRYANQENGTSLNGHFEIVSLVGQIDFQKTETSDSGHIHISCSDEIGQTIGGHLLSGNLVHIYYC
jgi:uncharacterized protein